MDIPHIYRPFELFLGLMQVIVGFPLFGRELLRYRKRPLRTWADNWRDPMTGLWFVTSGPAHLSLAFDPPHQESSLTGTLQWVALAGLAIVLTLGFVSWHLRKSQPEQTGTKIEK